MSQPSLLFEAKDLYGLNTQKELSNALDWVPPEGDRGKIRVQIICLGVSTQHELEVSNRCDFKLVTSVGSLV